MIVITAAVGASEIDILLSTIRFEVRGGDTVVLDLYLHNHTDTVVTYELPLSLPCLVIVNPSTVRLDARLMETDGGGRVDIPAKGGAKRQYSLAMPVYAIGAIQIKLETLDTNPVSLLVTKAPPEAWNGQQVPIDQGQTLAQSFLKDMSVHEPMYFLLGVDPGLEQSKFQLSFKYRFFNPEDISPKKPHGYQIFALDIPSVPFGI